MEAFDIEADVEHADAPADTNLDHEYSVPSTLKFTWLGVYFLFSLMLTLYNKLVLGMVSLRPKQGISSASSASEEFFAKTCSYFVSPSVCKI